VDRTELLARVRSLLNLKHRTDELEKAESVLFSLASSIEGKILTRMVIVNAWQSIRFGWESASSFLRSN